MFPKKKMCTVLKKEQKNGTNGLALTRGHLKAVLKRRDKVDRGKTSLLFILGDLI